MTRLQRVFATVLLCPVCAFAAVESEPVAAPPATGMSVGKSLEELRVSEQEQEQRLKAIQDRAKSLNGVVEKKTKAYSAAVNNAGTASFVWQDQPESFQRRKKLERMLEMSIREELRELEQLSFQEADLRAELEWVRLRMREASEEKPLAPIKAGNFRCDDLPVSPAEGKALSLLQDFGSRKDPDTGIEWRSLGWWLGQTGREVHACAPGTVVFVGKVQGRGRVIVLDHGDGGMTLYANLNDDPDLSFRKGEVVKAGRLLGTPRDKVYFEARRNGTAVNPREILPAANLAKVGL